MARSSRISLLLFHEAQAHDDSGNRAREGPKELFMRFVNIASYKGKDITFIFPMFFLFCRGGVCDVLIVYSWVNFWLGIMRNGFLRQIQNLVEKFINNDNNK